MKVVAVIDYGMSNLHSVSRALEHVAGKEWRVVVSDKASTVDKADKVVFPGQGASGNCIALLQKTGLDEAIRTAIHSHKPFFGICLGLQTLLTRSEESGGTPGFDAVKGTVRRFPEPLLDPETGERLKIPHMGWNQVNFSLQHQQHPLWNGISEGSRFYFVHSYYADPNLAEMIAATTPYAFPFTSVLAFDNVFAVQFHPEKSQQSGLTLLKNFLNW